MEERFKKARKNQQHDNKNRKMENINKNIQNQIQRKHTMVRQPKNVLERMGKIHK